jgi:membrane protease YdiL (CAAX protease family)
VRAHPKYIEKYIQQIKPVSRMKPLETSVNKEIIQFFLLTYLISWSIWGIIILFPETMGEMYFLIIIGAFGPFISAAILTRIQLGKEEIKKWRKNILKIRKYIRWHLIGGLGIPFLIALLHIGYYSITQDLPLLQTDPPWYWLIPSIPINVFVVFVYSSAFGEEPGWQGYAMPRLLQQYTPIISILILGFLWALWHLPLSYIPIWSGYEPLHLMLLYTPALAVITTWLTQNADGSVMPAVFLHYATNLYGNYLLGTDIFIEPLSENFTLIKTVIYWLIAIILLIRTSGNLDIHQE